MAESYTVSQLAEKLSCSGQTVRALINKGVLPAFRVGRDFRISVDDLESLRVVTTGSGSHVYLKGASHE